MKSQCLGQSQSVVVKGWYECELSARTVLLTLGVCDYYPRPEVRYSLVCFLSVRLSRYVQDISRSWIDFQKTVVIPP